MERGIVCTHGMNLELFHFHDLRNRWIVHRQSRGCRFEKRNSSLMGDLPTLWVMVTLVMFRDQFVFELGELMNRIRPRSAAAHLQVIAEQALRLGLLNLDTP